MKEDKKTLMLANNSVDFKALIISVQAEPGDRVGATPMKNLMW